MNIADFRLQLGESGDSWQASMFRALEAVQQSDNNFLHRDILSELIEDRTRQGDLVDPAWEETRQRLNDVIALNENSQPQTDTDSCDVMSESSSSDVDIEVKS